MSKSDSQLQVTLDLAVDIYNREGLTHHELVQSEELFLEVLNARVENSGPDSADVAYIHWYLGLLYTKFSERFDDGEAHFNAAFKNYTDPVHLAAIAAAHANLLVKKGNWLLEEARDYQQDIEEADYNAEPIVTPAHQPRFGTILKRKDNEQEKALAAAQERVLDAAREKAASALDMADANSEAADAFRRAQVLCRKAYDLTDKVAREAAKAKSEARASGSTSTALAVSKPKRSRVITYKSPAEIFAGLDKLAIGQTSAKRGLANAASQHIRRIKMKKEDRQNTDKSNVMLAGPTGCGKTLLAVGLAKLLDVPYHVDSATKLTAAGYVGADVESILVGLLRNCDFDVELAQQGIIYLDEIDKIASNDTGLDVGGESVQEELLTIIEGTKISVPKDGNNKTKGEWVEIDTSDILFILGGAFPELPKIIERRRAKGKSSIGFGAELRRPEESASSNYKHAIAEDFIQAGFLAEFIGRVPKRLGIECLTVNELERILTEPERALVTQKRLLLAGTTDLLFTRGALRAIAEEAQEMGTNGRALREIVEEVLDPIIFNEPKAAIITADMVRNRKNEIDALNGAESSVPVIVLSPFVIDDDKAEAALAEALSTADPRANKDGGRRNSGRELVVTSR